MMDYRGAPQAFEMLTLTELLAGEFDPEMLRDRIVFVGVTADSTPDLILQVERDETSYRAGHVEIVAKALGGRHAARARPWRA